MFGLNIGMISKTMSTDAQPTRGHAPIRPHIVLIRRNLTIDDSSEPLDETWNVPNSNYAVIGFWRRNDQVMERP